MEQQRSMNQSVDHVKASHSLSVNYPTANNASGEIIPVSKIPGTGKEDLFANDEVLHEYPDLPTNKKFVKSVDEGTFTKLKQGTAKNNATASALKDRGQSLNTIEHAATSQFGQ